jgi:hypothetical protein
MHEKWNQVLQISNANIHETQPKLEESHTKEQSHQRNQNWLAKVGDRARDPHEHAVFSTTKKPGLIWEKSGGAHCHSTFPNLGATHGTEEVGCAARRGGHATPPCSAPRVSPRLPLGPLALFPIKITCANFQKILEV